MVYEGIAFLVTSGVLVYISRASLRSPRSHGFYRFFAWEFILALFLLNVEGWFRNPLVWYQVVSWMLLVASLIPLVLGVKTITAHGKPARMRAAEPQLLAFEKTTALVTTGIYGYIRHPMYSSLLFLTWGIFFKNPGWCGLFLAGAATLFLVITARVDEEECRRYFGDAYQDYMRKTRMFLPYLF